MMFSFDEANMELKKMSAQMKRREGAHLVLTGPEKLNRPIPEIPDRLIPGIYSFAWVIPSEDPKKDPQTPVMGQVSIEAEPEQALEEAGTSGGIGIGEVEALVQFKIAEKEAFYQRMIQLNNDTAQRVEQERNRLQDEYDKKFKASQALFLEQIKSAASSGNVSVMPAEREQWYEPLLRDMAPQLVPLLLNIVANMGAKTVSPMAAAAAEAAQ